MAPPAEVMPNDGPSNAKMTRSRECLRQGELFGKFISQGCSLAARFTLRARLRHHCHAGHPGSDSSRSTRAALCSWLEALASKALASRILAVSAAADRLSRSHASIHRRCPPLTATVSDTLNDRLRRRSPTELILLVTPTRDADAISLSLRTGSRSPGTNFARWDARDTVRRSHPKHRRRCHIRHASETPTGALR